MRKESRGTHIRVDCPEVNHRDYLKRIIWNQGKHGMTHAEEKPAVVKFPSPEGKDPDIINYLFNEEITILDLR